MTNLEINATEMEGLARKLDGLDTQLSVRERALLSLVFRAAGATIGRSNSSRPAALGAFSPQFDTSDEDTLGPRPLREQFLDAFRPGDDSDADDGNPQKVGNLIVTLPPSKERESR
jgi:hypothetical protein